MPSDIVQKIKQIAQSVYKSPKIRQCPDHNMVQEQVCLKKKCKQYLNPKCKQCDHNHKRMNIKKIVPQLSHWIVSTWQDIQSQNIQIESEWKICEVNINYCFDILKQVQKLIQSRKVHELPTFQHLLQSIMEMNSSTSVQNLLHLFSKLNDRYDVFESGKANSEQLTSQREFRLNKWKTMGTKTKIFSEKALAFSQTLAQTVEEKLKHEKRMKKLEQVTSHKILVLKDLLKENLQEIKDLKIEMSSKGNLNKNNVDESENSIQQNLQKCENLKTLYINNKNGLIVHRTWKIITNKLQYLKRLRQLKLNLRIEDVRMLTKLFKEKKNSVRHIEVLQLTVTDQPKLDVREICQFCNSIPQLKELYLTLTRDNISKKDYELLLKQLRIHSTLTSIPMSLLSLNISKNKIVDQRDVIECQDYFHHKCKQVKKKSIII